MAGFLDDFLMRAGTRLLPEPPAGSDRADYRPLQGDHAFSPNLEAEFPAGPGKPAAVLIPLVSRNEEACILLTRRSSALRNHSGQIAFPGGRIDPEDDGPFAAALREAEEEIGLPPARVGLVGYGDLYLTTSGYRIVPVVGLLAGDFTPSPNPTEVDGTFEVPLAFLMDPANHRRETRDWRGAQRSYYAMPYGEHYIWGVTAGILRNLYERVYR
jgi:8-oxo-dGTP pyrophosphatase MutT (NUDIX family)